MVPFRIYFHFLFYLFIYFFFLSGVTFPLVGLDKIISKAGSLVMQRKGSNVFEGHFVFQIL